MQTWDVELPGVYYSDGGRELISDALNCSSGGSKYVILPDKTYERVSGDATEFLLSKGCKKPNDVSVVYEQEKVSSTTTLSNNQLIINLINAKELAIRIYTHSGRQVHAMSKENFTAGVHHINFSDLSLAAGVYLIQIEGAGLLEVHSFSVIK